MGFNATGENGYHGYAWRHNFREATLRTPTENAERDIETVEAEIVFLARAWRRASPANNTSKGSPEIDSSSLVGFLFDKLKVSWSFLRSVSGSTQFP
jgi:hypothetical protein